jgi:hypothetical protein
MVKPISIHPVLWPECPGIYDKGQLTLHPSASGPWNLFPSRPCNVKVEDEYENATTAKAASRCLENFPIRVCYATTSRHFKDIFAYS